MKKLIFSCLLAGVLSAPASAYIDLYGIFVRINQQRFYCAMISTKLCARISAPDWPVDPPLYHITTYKPDGTTSEDFDVSDFKITEDGDKTTVDYLP